MAVEVAMVESVTHRVLLNLIFILIIRLQLCIFQLFSIRFRNSLRTFHSANSSLGGEREGDIVEECEGENREASAWK